MHGFFSFGCRFGAVAGWGMILGLGPNRLGFWEDVWMGGPSRDRGLGVLAFLKQYTN